MDKKVKIYDTTLRDGSQGEGINFSLPDKIKLAEKLAAFGVDYIEGGWPGSNNKDIAFFDEAKKKEWGNCKITAFGSTRRPDTKVEDDPQVKLLLEAETPAVTFFGKTWLLHVEKVLRTSADENRSMIFDTVKHLKDHGREVIYDAEHFFDGFKDNADYAVMTLKAAADAGADCLALCDTNGGTLPSEIHNITQTIAMTLSDVKIGIHTHNDCGLGVANAIAAVEAGASQIQGTMNGFGERTGNCNLTSILPILELKMNTPALPHEHIKQLRELSDFVDELANQNHDPRAPFVGSSAFAHKGGMHVNAVNKTDVSYEHIEPESVGNRQRILVGELSGRTNVMMKATQLGIDLEEKSPEARRILEKIKELEMSGYEFESADASFELLVRRELGNDKPFFELEEYHISVRKNETHGFTNCEGTIKIMLDGVLIHTVANGDGPVNALDAALRKALSEKFPAIEKIQLFDYKVRIIDSASGTAARTRVLIESSDGKHEWGTVGVSDNVVEASWLALVDSVEYFLIKGGFTSE
ncbi:MAG: citramalate synthase [Verrucomicrobiota bacterium]